jgi:hypothetical protein
MMFIQFAVAEIFLIANPVASMIGMGWHSFRAQRISALQRRKGDHAPEGDGAKRRPGPAML